MGFSGKPWNCSVENVRDPDFLCWNYLWGSGTSGSIWPTSNPVPKQEYGPKQWMGEEGDCLASDQETMQMRVVSRRKRFSCGADGVSG